MGLREDIIAAAAEILAAAPDGLTVEALARQISVQVGRQVPPRQVVTTLQGAPRQFVQGPDGRWRLREQQDDADGEDLEAAAGVSAPGQAITGRAPLQRGHYVVFDLEAIGQDATSPATEIIQIAACRWIEGRAGEPWDTFVRPSGGVIPPHITQLTTITNDHVRDAPSAAEALRRFFDYVGDLPLIAHNGAGYDGPLITAT